MTPKDGECTRPSDRLRALFVSGLEGQGADYAEFLRALLPWIRRLVRHRLNDSDVDDVVQEVLISVHKARHTYDGQRPLMPWLHAMVRFRLNDHLRDHYRHQAHREERPDPDEWMADVTNQGADREYLDELLQDLKPLQQQILWLLHVHGHTAKEAGLLLGMNESAVKVAAHRALQKIRQKYAP